MTVEVTSVQNGSIEDLIKNATNKRTKFIAEVVFDVLTKVSDQYDKGNLTGATPFEFMSNLLANIAVNFCTAYIKKDNTEKEILEMAEKFGEQIKQMLVEGFKGIIFSAKNEKVAKH